jgi:hypothetical protein
MNQSTARKRVLLLILLVSSIAASASAAQTQAGTAFPNDAPPPLAAAAGADAADAFVRTDLFFGTDRNHLPPVSDDDWRLFLKTEITKRFPDGLTVLTADGQYMDSSGRVIKEKSFVVILLYPLRQWKESSHRIEQIRKLYTTAFKQQSVLRVDYPQTLRVSF